LDHTRLVATGACWQKPGLEAVVLRADSGLSVRSPDSDVPTSSPSLPGSVPCSRSADRPLAGILVWAFLLPVAVLGYTAYRLGLTVAAVRADRAGDTERAQSLREKAFYFGRGSSCLMLLLFFVVVVAILVL
jgi:hypothetical protein